LKKQALAQSKVMTEDLTTIPVEKVVDSRGTLCPVPVLAASKAIAGVSAGGVMEVQATDAGAGSDIPAWARRTGNEFLGTVPASGYLRLFVRKARE
jgi:tRNA 2-thiouridine synthesizing protein A